MGTGQKLLKILKSSLVRMPWLMMLVVVVSSEMRCPMSGSGTKVNGCCIRLSFSHAYQSTLHCKFEVKILFGQFLVTKVTAGQLIALPNFKIKRLEWRVFKVFLTRIGVKRMRLILRLVLVYTLLFLRIS